MNYSEALRPTMPVEALFQRAGFLVILISIVLLLAIERLLLHRRLMVELKHQARISEEIDFSQPRFPYASIGLLLAGIGFGLIVDRFFRLNMQLTLIILFTGIFFFAWGAYFDQYFTNIVEPGKDIENGDEEGDDENEDGGDDENDAENRDEGESSGALEK